MNGDVSATFVIPAWALPLVSASDLTTGGVAGGSHGWLAPDGAARVDGGERGRLGSAGGSGISTSRSGEVN